MDGKTSMVRYLKRSSFLVTFAFILSTQAAQGATETFNSGSFIINMGVVPQTVNNGLKPYGLIYELIKNYDVPIKWVINPSKVKDGIDFTYGGQSYRGGTFIIHAEYRSAAVNAAIASWQAQGVLGVTTTTSITLNVSNTLRVAPYWAMDSKNGSIAIGFLNEALIPSTAYYYRSPATLTCCDDLYVMPHADPTWATHSNLYFWNLNCRGGIWAGCHAVSVMEGPACVNPSNASQNLKFLSTYGLIDFSQHANGTPPYSYLNYSDPVFQMMGTEDLAHNNGSEKIYLPVKTTSNWHAGVKIGCYDPTHSDIPTKSDGLAVLTAYGRGFNDVNRGYVMYQGGHNIGGTLPDEVSAQREFFNWSFLVATDKAPVVTYSNIPATMTGLQMYPTFTANVTSPAGLTSFTYQWFSTIGGTFSAPTSNVSNFTPPAVGSITSAIIYCKVTDGCGRKTIEPVSVTILPPPTAPVAVNDSINFSSLCTPVPNTINVLVNDYDVNGNMSNSITFIGGGNYGTFTNNGSGSVTYNPGPLFIGVDTMRYQVCDNTTPFPLCSQAKIIVNTGGAGICAIYQYYRTDTVVGDFVQFQNAVDFPDSCLGFPNQSNGNNANSAYLNTDADSIIIRLGMVLSTGDTIRIRAGSDNNNCVDFVAQGSLTSGGFVNGVNTVNISIPAGGSKTYSYYNFIVTQSTQYLKIKNQITACDNNFNFDGVYSIHRGCTSASPIANGESTSTGQNTSVTTNVRSNDSDPQSLPLSVSIFTLPANGTATVNGAGNIVYTPNIGFTGTDQITYKVCNSSCLCDTAILTITVTGNPCPGTKIGQFISGNATTLISSSNVTNPSKALGIADASNGSNANTAIISNIVGANLILDLTDTVTAGNTIVIRMAPDLASGTTIRVQGNISNSWGSPSTSTNFNLPAGTARTFADYNFVVNDSTRYIKLIQQTTNCWGDVDAASFSFWLCRNIPNRAPQANNDTASTYVNRAITKNVTLNDIDPDGNALTVSIINPAPYIGTATASGGSITYTPDFGVIGTDTVTYLVCDNGTPSLCDTGLLIITNIYPGPPVAITDNKTILSGSPVLINVQTNDTLAVNSYSYTTSLAPALLSASNGTTVLVGNSIQYTPNAGFTGVDSFAYNICDNGIPSTCDSAIVFVTVDNRFPVANADVDTTAACNSVIINVIANDTDPENGIKTVTSVSVPSNGTAVISNNQIVYTPSSSPVFTGVATFTYQVCDNGIPTRCATGNVSVTVNSNNPPSNPPTVINDTGTTFIGQSIPISVLSNDSDPDADSIRVDSTAIGLQAPAKGTIQYLPNNQIRYIPNPGTFGLDSFQYKVCDIHISGAGCINIISTCSIGKVYVWVLNRPPVANDDSIATLITYAISNTVATNDIEPDNQPMTFSVIRNPAHGTITMNSSGGYTFTPDGLYSGIDTVIYSVCDNFVVQACDTAYLFINIGTLNVPPNPQADTITTTGSLPYSGTVATNDSDPNGNLNPTSYSMTSGATNGTITFNNNGSYTYTANTGFIGTDYVFYSVCDSGAPIYCTPSYLTIIVPNLPPVTYNENLSVNEDNSLIKIAGNGILSNGDYDPNLNSLKVTTSPLVNPLHGTLTVQSTGAFTYNPSAGYNGADYFVVNVCDSTYLLSPLCTADTVFITVLPVNDPPIISNDIATTNEGTPLLGTILTAGDYDTDTTALSANTVPVDLPNNGTFVINAAGNYTYTPNALFNGKDTVVISICDSGRPLPALCVNDTLFITINPVNNPPVIVNDNVSTNEATPISGTILTAGDYDPDTTALSANTVPVDLPNNGTFVINAAGNYTYTPNALFNGKDTVVISICDSGTPLPSICRNDTLFITVNPVNNPPIIVNDTISTNEATAVSGTILTAGDYDPDTTALSANIIPVDLPNNGTFVINAAGNYTYTPNALFNGKDTVVISICDSGTPLPSICRNDTLFITVNPVNNPPVIVNDNVSTNEATPVSGTILTAGDYDPDTTALSANTVPVDLPNNGTFVINAAGNYTYTPNAFFNGNDTVVISICDSGRPLPAICVNDTLIITVNAVNDPPVIINDAITTNEDTPVSGTVITGGDYDPDLTVLSANTTPVVGPSNGSIVVNSNGTYTYTPNLNFNGTDVVVISICDNGIPLPALCVNDTLTITVLPVNDPPAISSDTGSTPEGTPVSGIIITGTDFDPDTTVLVVDTIPVSGPGNGTFTIDSLGNYTYTPDSLFNGTDTVIISICDGGTPLPAICENDTLIFIVTSVNDTPVIANDVNTTNEDIAVSGTVITGADADPDATVLSANTTPVAGPSNGSIIVNSNGTYTYTPNLNFNGTDQIIISICDSGLPLPAICVNDTLTITVLPVNDPPVISSDTGSTPEGTPVSGIIITGTDFDPDTTVLVVDTIPVSGPGNGAFTIDSLGNYTYTPDSLFNGTDTVIISICDGGTPLPAICENDTLIFTVTSVNDTPVIANDVNTTNEDIAVSGTVITGADADPDATVLSANTTPVAGPSNGSIIVNSNGTYTYTPNLNFNGTDQIIISICDSGLPLPAICVNDTLTITILPVNDPPVISNDFVITNEGTALSGNVITASDYDPDTTMLIAKVILIDPPNHGTFSINASGNYTYNPSVLYNGPDTVVINICDAGRPFPSICRNDTLFITVNAVNNPPIIFNESKITNEDTPVNGTVINGDYDLDLTTLTADTTLVAGPSHGSIILNSNGTYTYTPDLNYNGVDTIIISICDNGIPLPAICVNDTLIITVVIFNDPPVISSDTGSTTEGTPVSGTVLTGTDYDPDSTALVVDTIPVFGPNHGTIDIDSLGNYTYIPDSLFNGMDTVIISICDEGLPLPAKCENDTLIFTVGAVNDSPVISNDGITTNEDIPVSGTFITSADADPDGTPLTANTTAVAGPLHGTITINSDGSYLYTPDPDYNGFDQVIINVCDSGLPLPAICKYDTLNIIVQAVNDPPVISNDSAATQEDVPVIGTILNAGDFDPDTTNLTVDNTPLYGPLHGSISMDSLGNYTYTPNPYFNGIDTIIFTICDGGTPLPKICRNDTIIITIQSVNNSPVAVNDSANVCAKGSILINPCVNDYDIDGDTINITSIIQPTHGIATLNNKTITYVPNPIYIGQDSITYTICDSTALPLCSTAVIYIDVHGIFSTSILATEVLCYGDSTGSITLNPLGDGPFTYQWKKGMANISNSQNLTNIPQGLYSVTITDSLGCSLDDSATVNQPAAALALSGTTSDINCFGDSTGSISVSVSGGTLSYSYQWNNGISTKDLLLVPAATYTLIVVDNNGCTDSLTATINQPSSPITINALTNPANCLLSGLGSIDATISGGSPGYTYSWSNGQSTQDISDVGGNYTLTLIDNKGCTDSATFTINDVSVFTVNTTDSTSFCAGGQATLNASISSGSFQWNFNGNPIPAATSIAYQATQTGQYSVTINNSCGIYISDTIAINANAIPIISVSGTIDICEGSSTQLNASGATTYFWAPASGLDDPNIANPVASPTNTTNYLLTGAIGNCSSVSPLTITVHPLPIVTVTSTPYDCKNGTQLNASGGANYLWTPLTGLNFANIANPVALPGTTTTYTVTVTDSLLCATTSSITVVTNCDDILEIPTGISPGDDGPNDTWVINGLQNYPGNHISIFNRWGNIVFEARPYQNDWQGKCTKKGRLAGEALPDGTYYYIIELGEDLKVKTGFIEIRNK